MTRLIWTNSQKNLAILNIDKRFNFCYYYCDVSPAAVSVPDPAPAPTTATLVSPMPTPVQ
jgi:hypothetical protein